tara:strand:- start:1639 stop:2682 length:1044 start_codon:yes stop_codon:yes gene_type:complete
MAKSKIPSPGARPTIADVAKASGLAPSTISKALNHSPDKCPLTERTRLKALKAAQEMGYKPAWAAQALRRQSTRTIGLLHWSRVPEASEAWHDILEVLVDLLHQNDYDLQFIPNSERLPQILQQGRFDGIVVAHSIEPHVAKILADLKLPAVMLNAQDELLNKANIPDVTPDDHDAALQLGRYLIRQGHKHIAYVSTHPYMRHFSYFQRLAGTQAAVKEAKLKYEVRQFKGPVGSWIDRILTEQPLATALVCYSDVDALPLLSALWQRGVKVPEQISVATFNDTPFTLNAIPPLTTMRIPMQQMAQQAARLLLEQLGHADAFEDHQPMPMLASELIIRASTAPPSHR